MSGIATAIVGTAVVGGIAQSRAAKKASSAQTESAQAGIDEQSRQFDKLVQLMKPYVQAGAGTAGGEFDAAQYLRDNPDVAANSYFSQNPLEHYQKYGKKEGRAFPTTQAVQGSLGGQQALLGLLGPEAQQQAIGGLEQSPQFQSLVQQGENALLQNASATGGLRGGNLQGALAQYRPQLLSQLIESQFSKLGGLTQIGQAAAAGQASAGLQTGANVGNLLQQQGQARAGGALAQGQAIGQIAGSLGNFASMKGLGAF